MSSSLKLRFSQLARCDLLATVDRYAAISEHLADRFVDELVGALRKLCIRPGMGARRYAHFLEDASLRTWQLERFPFLLFCRALDRSLDVLRLLHVRSEFEVAPCGDALS